MHIYRPMPASNLSKDATQDIRKALHYTSQNDVHGLFEETGLLTNDIKKYEERIFCGAKGLKMSTNEHKETYISYDSDGDGKYDRNACFREDGSKLTEDIFLHSKCDDDTPEYLLSFDTKGNIEQLFKDTENDGDYDYYESGSIDGYFRLMIHDEKTGQHKCSKTIDSDGSEFVRIGKYSKEKGYEYFANYDKDKKRTTTQEECPPMPPTN